jgi:hypothetical protein
MVHLRLSLCPALLLLAAALVACPGDTGNGPVRDSSCGGKTVSVSGRVVDFESCITTTGCQGIGDMRVALFYDTTVVSKLTATNGAFTLENVPNGVRTYLLVTDASGNDRYLSTLQAEPVTTKGKPVFSVEAFAIARDKALYRSIGDELSADVASKGIYIGQVLDRSSDTFKAFQGAGVTVAPSATVRYLKTNLDLDPTGKEAFFPPTHQSTGIFGQFVVLTDAAPADYAVLAKASAKTFTATFVPIGAGYVTVGLHRGSAAGGGNKDAGAAD